MPMTAMTATSGAEGLALAVARREEVRDRGDVMTLGEMAAMAWSSCQPKTKTRIGPR